jgi:hydrogenase maturation protease
VIAARIAGVGQPRAGDDGLGPAVVARLRARGLPDGVLALDAPDPVVLVDWLEDGTALVVVDAVVGGASPGRVHRLAPDDLTAAGLRPPSTHGLGVLDAIALARAIHPAAARARVELVVVEIDEPPPRAGEGLSPAIAASVDEAARAALAAALRASSLR